MYQIAGKQAEKVAAKHLKKCGYIILDTNWRRPNCEIDIIAKEPISNRVHLFEVKYRRNFTHGSPLEMITKVKLNQMVKAKEIWVSETGYIGECELGVVSVLGTDFRVDQVIDTLSF